jgi:hypothetical protein
LATFIAVIALGAFSSDRIARADDGDVGTKVTVVAGGTDPVIECKWELPDMVPGLNGASLPDNEIDYDRTGTPPPHQHDDNMAVQPDADGNSANGNQYPCDLPTTPNSPPTQPDGVHRMIQVAPNPADLPEQRKIQLWMAVDTFGQTNVSIFWKVFEKGPTGAWSLKVQVDLGDPGTGQIADAACTSSGILGNTTTARTMFEAAYHTGQISQAAIEDTSRGLLAKCKQDEKQLYYGRFDLSKHQPCGEYKIEAHAGNTILTNYIDVICIYSLATDVSSIDCGTLAQNTHPTCSGDDVWGAGTLLSVQNFGNHGMGLDAELTAMCEWDSTLNAGAGGCVSGGFQITRFDLKFGKAYGTGTASDNLQIIDPVDANQNPSGPDASFDNNIRRVLCTNEHGKFDLSLYIGNQKPAEYRGKITLIGRAVHNPQIVGLAASDVGCEEDQETHATGG